MALNESLAHLLDERRIATITTYSADGLPHVTAVWFLYENGALHIATNTNASKARNLRRDPRMAICIESRQAGREAGLSACGEAELLVGESAAPLARRINAKYLTGAAFDHPLVGPAFEQMSDLVIRLTPKRWISWDMAALGEQLFGDAVDETEFFRPLLP
jgi:PPOX class probable F420-dependent enzyme